MSAKKSKKPAGNVIAVNRRARHDYFIEDTLEAGLVLEGWEVKSLRAGNAQLKEGYVNISDGIEEDWKHCMVRLMPRADQAGPPGLGQYQ